MPTRSQRSERRGAKLDSGRTTPRSGGGRVKGDYATDLFRVEDRTTTKRSYSISLDGRGWLKIEREAHLTPPTLSPMMRITLAEGTRDERTLRVIDERDWLIFAKNFAESAVPGKDAT